MVSVSVVIPSIKDEIITLESIPEEVDTHVVREGTLNEARNIGVLQADHDQILILDDDISFSHEFFEHLIGRIERQRLVGYPDWDYGWIAGRVMGFHRADWVEIGGFDELLKSHMGDTEFALNFLTHGKTIEQIDADKVEHVPHERSVTTMDRLWRLGYLCLKYPRYAPRLLAGSLT